MAIEFTDERYPDVEKAARDLVGACKRHGFNRLHVLVDAEKIISMWHIEEDSDVAYYATDDRVRAAMKEE